MKGTRLLLTFDLFTFNPFPGVPAACPHLSFLCPTHFICSLCVLGAVFYLCIQLLIDFLSFAFALCSPSFIVSVAGHVVSIRFHQLLCIDVIYLCCSGNLYLYQKNVMWCLFWISRAVSLEQTWPRCVQKLTFAFCLSATSAALNIMAASGNKSYRLDSKTMAYGTRCIDPYHWNDNQSR